MTRAAINPSTIRLDEVLKEFDERLGARQEPEVLTLTEKHGFVAQRVRFKKRLATADTSNYKAIGLHDIAFNPYLLWAGAVACNSLWDTAIVSPLYPTFRVREGYDASFLDYVLRSNALRLLYDGISFGSVPRKRRASVRDFLNLRIPRPPALSAQRRIAELISRADGLRAKRRDALARLDSLAASIFLDMFGDPAVNPRRWPSRPLHSLAVKFSDGPFGSNLKTADYTETGVRVIRLQNIGVGQFKDKDRVYISGDHFARLDKHECVAGDVLVGTLGDPNLRACIQPASVPVALNKADCVQIRPDARVANAAYICALLNQPAVEHMAQELMHGQTRIRISMGRLRGLEVPVPPLDLQRGFARRLDIVDCLREMQQESTTQLNSLFASIEHAAFQGLAT